MRKLLIFNFLILACLVLNFSVSAQGHGHEGHGHGHDHSAHNHNHHNHDHHNHEAHGGHHAMVCGHEVSHDFNVSETAMHHIGDANVYSIGPLQLPLPVITYSKDAKLEVFSTNKFKNDLFGHGDGMQAYNRYVLHLGTMKRIKDASFPTGEQAITGFVMKKNGKQDVYYACDGNKLWELENKSTADFGVFGGGITSFFDFSPTKNVVSMLLVSLFLFFVFRSAAKAYARREGKEPRGLQSFIETFVVFIRDEVAIPFIGAKWEKFFSFLLAIFFFILGLNLFGQIPFLGGSNVTGNLGVTMVLAIIVFIVTNINGNKHYWEHQLIAPGIPFLVKLILVPVEIMGMFIKPLTLMLRLFANITAGHIVLVVFVGLIFIFGKNGESYPGTAVGVVGSTILTLFMMAIELIVALVQAFVFTILTASYLGAATEEAHH